MEMNWITKVRKYAMRAIPLLGLLIIISFIAQIIIKPIKDTNNVANIVSLDKTPSDTVRDIKGQLHAQKEYITVPDYRLAEALYSSIIDSLKHELKLSKRAQVVSGGTITTQTQVEFTPEVTQDSLGTVYSFKDKWVDLEVYTDTSKKSSLQYRDSLIFGTIEEPYGLFGLKEKKYITVRSSNPDVKHLGVTYFEVAPSKNNKSKIGLGVGVGPGVTVQGPGNRVDFKWITINVGLQYRF